MSNPRVNICDNFLLSGLLIRTIVLLVIIFSFSSAYLQAQKITKNNYSGEFTDNNTWQNPPSPNLANTAVVIYGDIQHTGDLTFGRNLTIHDTLRIYGNVSLGNNCDLTINPGGIFIVYGNYSSDNHVSVITGGYLIVTGSFSQSGAANQGSFDITGGGVYLFDPNPQIKAGANFADLQCNPDCGYGNEEDLQSEPIWSFFEPATYIISASGPPEFCEGGSVTLSVPDDGNWYQWYRDNSEISGANSNSFNAIESGDYHLRMLVGTDTLTLTPLTILVYSNSSPPASVMTDRNNICPGDGSIILSYTGGSMGTGATAEWYSDAGFTLNIGSGNGLSVSAPLITTTYYVRFEGDCDTTTAASIALAVLPASPVPTISLNAIVPVPINTPTINIGYSAVTGSPSLYSITWSGPAISAGFANITDAPLPASPVSITLPVGMDAGQTYTGSLIVKNTCNTSSEYPISISVLNIILGVNPHATVAYSLRKLSPTYSGPAVMVRRSSDNLTQDIGFNAEGNLDEVALLAFTGSVNAYITIWYDQSGNGRNAIQSNSNNQPILVENGVVNLVNGKPMLRFDGTNDLLNYSNPPANNFSIFTLARTSLSHEIDPESNSGTGGTAGQRYLLGAPHGDANAGQGISFGTNGISNYEHGAGYMPATAVYSGNITGLSQINVLYTNRRPSIYLDGMLVRTGLISGRPTVTASTQIGSGSYGAFNGEIPELIIFPTSLSNTDRQTIVFNQSCHYLLAELTPGAVPGISPDATSASLPFNGGVNQSWTYSITWDAAAIAAGFINITNENLPVTPVSINVPSGISEGDVFNGTFTAISLCGASIPDHPVTIRVLNKILALDSYSSSAYSLRKIASAYTGPAVRLRRSSDGQLRDVYFDSGETVSLNSPVSDAGGGTPTALTLSGWIGGGSATVRIWYDQSGNVKHANQSTTAAQPLLVSNGGLVAINTRPMIQFDGVNDLLSYNNPPENNFSIFTIARTTLTHQIDPQSISGADGVNNQRYLMGSANRGDDAGQGISLGTNGISNYEHGNSYMPATAVYSGPVIGLNLVDILYNNRRPYIYMNGNLVRTGLVSPKTTVYASYEIGGMNYGYFNGNIPEIIIFPYTVSTTERQQIECNQIEYYSIFGPASASIDRNNICPGDGNITLSYSGGNLRAGATAEWYSDSALTVNVGSGNNLSVPAPTGNSEYFVRFEGVCNTSLPVSASITIKDSPIEPDTAISNRPAICPSDGTIVLSFSGGSPGSGGIARWYTDAAFTSLVGTGNNISIPAPAATQTYYIRYEADCGNSPADSVTVIVNPLPVVTLDPFSSVCINAASFALSGGNPIGGTYSGTGVSDGNFNPATAGLGIHTITYTYTDGNGCINSASQNITVNDLPTVTMDALVDVCANAASFALSGGLPLGGTYSGTGVSAGNFDPAIASAGTHTITYTYTDGNGCTSSASQSITVNPLPILSFTGLISPVCEGTSVQLLTGNLAPLGMFSGTGITDNSNGTASLNTAITGVHEILYYYTNINSCSDTARQTISINPLPVVNFTGLDAEYCLNTPNDTLTGSEVPGGSFFGPLITDLGNGQGIFSPSATGSHEIFYAFTDVNGCSDTTSQSVLVHSLPVVSFTGLDSVYDISDPIVPLTGNPSGGIYYGFGISGNNYNPALAGVRMDTVIYSYTDLNGCTSRDTSITNVKDYDFREGARFITSIDNWCSVEAIYTTIGATSDEAAGSCWPHGPTYNRWFKFQATTTEVKIEVKTGGTEGTLRRPYVALWDEAGNELACQVYYSDYADIIAGNPSLTPGEWYYISVDNHQTSGYRGTFTLCLDDAVDYDFKEGAVTVPHIPTWSSPDAAYSTLQASADRLKGTCWPTGPSFNRWFRFQATSAFVTVEVGIGGLKGNLRRPMVALWDESDNQLACARYYTDFDNVKMGYSGLVPGTWYYISVDNHLNTGYRGSFTLNVNNTVDYDFPAGAIHLTDLNNWCSSEAAYTTVAATPDGDRPTNWNSGPNYNRWFTFRATTEQVRVEMKTGGSLGTLRNGLVAIWDSAFNEINSARYTSEYSAVSASSTTLIPGGLYYISVDNYHELYRRGTFTLCLTDVVDYDFKEAAVELASIDNWCSPKAIYTTLGATPDREKGSLWPNGPNYNRWFKFNATTNQIKVELRTGGDDGTLRYGMIALWDSADNEIKSARYYSEYSHIVLSSNTLNPGESYWISVDNHDGGGYRGTFSLCVSDTLDYDFKEAAVILTDLNTWCSAEAAYTTIGATPDEEKGIAWNNGPNYNRWFRFQATKPNIKIDLKTGGTEGSLRYPFLALWDSTGNEIKSIRYTGEYSDITVSSTSLSPGDWYYISADNHTGNGYRGTFTLCVTDTIDYDYKEAAIEITNLEDWCSANAAYTTVGATPDRLKGSAWNNGPNYNRWFKFQATNNQIKIDLKTGGGLGSLRYPFLAIWNEGDTEVASTRYTAEYSQIFASSDTLTPGNWYYVSVDNHVGLGYRGTFTLCATDTLDYDYKVAAVTIPHTTWCSVQKEYSTIGATPDEQKGSVWPTGPNYNRWFKFQAVKPWVKIDMKTGGDDGTLQYPYLALWDSAGNEIASSRYYLQYQNTTVSAINLVPGEWYYISADNHNSSSYRGSFTLCIDDTVDYDFKEAPVILNNINNWCSPSAAYTTIDATADGAKGIAWVNGPNYNRWFKFQATGSLVKVDLKIGGVDGTLRYPYLAIWNENFVEVASTRYIGEYNSITASSDSLTPGNWYYISVDNSNSTSYRGTFSLCVTDTLDYDYKLGAFSIPFSGNWCSEEAEFTTVGATPDESRPSAWPTGPNYNRWFTFRATSNGLVTVILKTGGTEGNLRYPYLALWDSAGNELASARYSWEFDDISVGSSNLNPGELYYVSVDNHNSTTYQGSFSLCLKDTIDYDFRSGAIEVPHIDSWCSTQQQFTTTGATPDALKGSCWGSGPNYNRWFSFRASTEHISLRVLTGGSNGTIQYPLLALWDSAGNQIDCRNYTGQYNNLELTSNTFTLTPGELYYISVDNHNNISYRGTFTLCVENKLSYDFKEGAYTIPDITNWCSDPAQFTTLNATPDKARGSCLPNGPSYNRWFRFQATSNTVSAQLRITGIEGTLRRPYITLWTESLVQVSCGIYSTDNSDVEIYSQALIPGQWYFISVDNWNNTAYRGTFSLCVTDNIINDNKSGAILLNDLNSWCSADAKFTNSIASPDETAGSCWAGAENKNVWFSFIANSTLITIDVKTGGILGQMSGQQIALWDDTGNEIECTAPLAGQGNLTLVSNELTPGNLYYISVDDNGQAGTFTLCIDDDVSYDYPQGAFELTDLSNWCSPDAAFSNLTATMDAYTGSCWLGTQSKVVWFKFQANTPEIKVSVTTGGAFGTMQRQQMAIWNSEGTAVACAGYVNTTGTVIMQSDSLTVGNWYWIGVDDNLVSGSFTLCIDENVDFDFRQAAHLIDNISLWCSNDAEFSNRFATPDHNQGSCWTGAVNKNVWFTFYATTPFIRLQLKTGGVYGAMTRQQMAVFNSSGTEIGCARYINTTGTIVLQIDTLTAGDQYWISVDDDQTNGTFTLCTDDRPDYDYKEGAKLITNLNNWCSGDAVYSNFFATPDESMGSCWSGTVNKNVWFKFQATTRFITITNRTAGVYGSMRSPQMALWTEEGTEVQCKGPYISSGTAIITIDTLTPGNWYYLSVDDNNTSGSFSLCFNDQPTYDYKEGARVLNHNGGCSMDAEFSNFHATADQTMGSCWSGTENKNVWFKFQATTPYLTLSLRTGTIYGSMRRTQISLWQENGTEIKCTGPILHEGTTNMSADNLIPGEWYFISVDDNNTSGTFTLCIEDQLSYDYKAGAMLISDISNWCSPNTAYTNFFATPDENIGSCWTGTENKNVWFKFQATTRFVTVNLRSGTIYGGMRRPQMALWNESGAEVQCVGAIAYEGNVQLNIDTLTPGNWYYLSVDDNYTSGSFSLCFNDQPDYDYKEGAVVLNHDQGCSANQAYSNFYATPDQTQGSCWGGTLNKNVWFKFQATTTYLTLRLRTGTVYGSMRRAQAGVWTESGSEVKCLGPLTHEGTSLLSIGNLIIGDWYYISVDDNNTSGTFTLCIDDELDFDYWEGAKILDHNAGCSSNAAYTNFYATNDEAMGPCWSGTENKNVWFKFQATSAYATVSLRSGNVYGNMRRGQMALWNAGKENVKCVGPVYDYGTNIMSIDSLTVGDWYWISVDDNLTSGTFTLCLSDQPDYDYKAGAKIIPHEVWCSSDQEYTNAYATEDGTMAACWSGTANKNVWFKFQATGSFATIEVKTGTIEGTLRRAQAAIWNENGDLVKCVSDLLSTGSTSISVDSLTSGNWYYISVDDNNTPGTFALCMSNVVDYDYKAGAMDIIHNYGCYPELAFSNLLASPDGNQGSCWTGTVNKNVWFRFQAISSEVRAEIRTGTIYGALRTAQASIWNEAGTEISCNRLTSAGFMLVQSDTLTPGNWYYISVDDDQTSGSFTLCIGDEVDYDYRNGAIELANISKWCSVDAAYTNAQATPDGSQASCWTGTANKNVWFTFTAETRNAIINVLTGNVYGTMRRQQIALWNADGTQLGCARLAGTTGTLSLSIDTLTTGNQYWISVDDDNVSGTFTLCVNGNPLDADITGNNISCGETSNGSITVSPMGGSGSGYTYSWALNGSPFPFTTPVLTNLSAGVYAVTVTDAGDGTSVLRSITLIQIPALTLSLSKTDETCAGNSDASITASAGGGTSTAYLYTWAKNGVPIADVMPILTNQSEGWYMVTIQDAVELSCLKSDSIEVLLVNTASTNPSGIDIANNDICQGTPKTLTVTGGSLGSGANWKWYLNDSFTSSAGPDGISLIVDPAVNTTYWLRAEGICNTTSAVSATVLTGLPSTPPTSAFADRNNICPGDGSIILSYSGGSLGDGATAEWYSDPALTFNIGSGNNLTIPAPLNNSSYFVRFEGDCNTTSAVSTSINLLELPVAPDTAIVDRAAVCPSDGMIVLSYSGGIHGAGGVANWYSDAGFANLVGTGNNVSIPAPVTTQTYYIRYEADCGNSLAKSVTVTVNPLPTPAVNGPAEVCSPGTGTYGTTLNTGHSYTWTISGGAIIGPADVNEITLDFSISGAATLRVTEINNVTGCESVSTVYNVNIIETPVVNEIQSDRKLIER